MAFNLVASLLIFVVTLAISYALTPRVQTNRPDTVQELERPTADAGKPICEVFGTVRITSPNVIWYGDKQTIRENIT